MPSKARREAGHDRYTLAIGGLVIAALRVP